MTKPAQAQAQGQGATPLPLPVLRNYLMASGVGVTGNLRASVLCGGRSNLTYRLSDDVSDWVLRRPPVAGLTPSAHDVGREFRITAQLQSSNFPVPRTVLNCEDVSVLGAPFSVVEFVPGRALRTQQELAGVADGDLLDVGRQLLNTLAALHAVPYREFGLEGFGRPTGFVERQIRRWWQQWELVAHHYLPDVERLYRGISGAPPRSERVAIVHGDYRIDNTLIDTQSRTIRAVIDWEMSTIGDPMTDLATFCAYRNPHFDHVVGEPAASTSARWPTVCEVVKEYADLTGADVSEFGKYLGLAYFKLAVIAEGISARHLAGLASEPGFASAQHAVPGLVSSGLAALAGSW